MKAVFPHIATILFRRSSIMSIPTQNPVKLLKKHRKAIRIAIIFLFSAMVVITIQRAMAYDKLKKDYDELEATHASAEKS